MFIIRSPLSHCHRFIIPDPAHELSVASVRATDLYRQGWLAFQLELEDRSEPREGVKPRVTLLLLRSLSQTCRSLRAYVLPLLWRTVHISSISELGRLRDILRSTPSIAPLVRHFSFFWDMNEDYHRCNPYSEEHGTLLDMAFIDRGALWERIRDENNCKARSRYVKHRFNRPTNFFELDEATYLEPGELPRSADEDNRFSDYNELLDDDEWRAANREWDLVEHSCYPYAGANINRSGPDGKGEDRRIKNASDFISCMEELMIQIAPTLVNFGWWCPVTQITPRIFEALKDAKELSILYPDWTFHRGNLCTRK